MSLPLKLVFVFFICFFSFCSDILANPDSYADFYIQFYYDKDCVTSYSTPQNISQVYSISSGTLETFRDCSKFSGGIPGVAGALISINEDSNTCSAAWCETLTLYNNTNGCSSFPMVTYSLVSYGKIEQNSASCIMSAGSYFSPPVIFQAVKIWRTNYYNANSTNVSVVGWIIISIALVAVTACCVTWYIRRRRHTATLLGLNVNNNNPTSYQELPPVTDATAYNQSSASTTDYYANLRQDSQPAQNFVPLPTVKAYVVNQQPQGQQNP